MQTKELQKPMIIISDICAYARSVFAGTADPVWPHLLLISVNVLAAAAVGAGIIFEGQKYSSDVHRIATRFVIVGVFFEALSSILLFAFDERISSAQQSTIAALDVQLRDTSKNVAEANKKVADLLKENTELERAIAPRTVDPGKLAFSVRNFVREPIFVSASNTEESQEVVRMLEAAFLSFGFKNEPRWSVTTLPVPVGSISGITIQYATQYADPRLLKDSEWLSEAICKSLKDQGLLTRTASVTFNGLPITKDRSSIADWPAEAPINAVIIRVGVKPDNFWLNKILKAKGGEPIPKTDFCTSEEFFNSP